MIYFYYFQYTMNKQQHLTSMMFVVLMTVSLFSQPVCSYDCVTAISLKLLDTLSWGICYEASDTNLVGNTMGSLTNCWFTQCALWNYNYNTISYSYVGTNVWHGWSCYNHTNGTCCDTCGACGNCTNGTWDCFGYYCKVNQKCYFLYADDYYCDGNITTYVYIPCHPYCQTCTTRMNNNQCQSCRHTSSLAYLWLNWTDTSYQTCELYCPNRTYDNAFKGQYISVASALICSWCNATCSWCADFNGGNTCYTCISSAYLIDNYAECTAAFPLDPYCYSNKQCVTACPLDLYFPVFKASTTSSSYPWAASNPNSYVRLTNICYLCHSYCRRCTSNVDTACTSCASTYFKWQQAIYGTRCNYYCQQGVFTTGGVVGQYIDNSTSVVNRACGTCAAGCQFCTGVSTNCYICQNNYYLIDDKATCTSTYTCKLCKSPANGGIVTDGCATSDKQCRMNGCPAYFYFSLKTSANGGSGDSLVTNPKYSFFTNASTLDNTVNGYQASTTRTLPSSLPSPTPNPSILHRQLTNLCKLCDYRCLQCYGPSNTNCTSCINNFYKWTNGDICQSYCPTGQFKLDISASYPDNETKCGNCDVKCIACTGFMGNCSSCQIFPTANYAFLYTYAISNSTCLSACPTSSTPLTTKGYYGSIGSMTCYPCPGQCSNCNIDLVIANYVLLQPIDCGSDSLCGKGVQCTSCLQGYSLVAGTCVNQYTCRQYSYYLQGNTSSTWSSTNCVCLEGYYLSSYLTCSLCDLLCKTCNGPSSSNCLSCQSGYVLTSGSCSSTSTGNQVYRKDTWITSGSTVTSSGYLTSTYNSYSFCGSYYTLFGFQGTYTTSNYYQYSTPSLYYPNFYAISFKMTVLFIDNWSGTAGLYFSLNSPSAYPSFVYTYNNYGSIGEQQCGTNALDYLLVVSGQIELSPSGLSNSYSLYVSPNTNPIQNSSGFYYQWGLQNAVFTVKSCHSDCYTCTGPASNQCKSCWDSMKYVSNGSCVCNSAAGYFYVVGSTTSCTTGCPTCFSTAGTSLSSCYYADLLIAKCVNPPIVNCTAPYIYGQPFELSNSYGTCVQNCSSSSFAISTLLKCTSSCSQFSLYHYSAASAIGATVKLCLSTCPLGFIADPSTMWCVTRCPTNYYFMIQNRTIFPLCTSNCPSGFQYDLENICTLTCPSGYYTQVINGHNKCQQICAGSYFGDNITQSCISFCPSPAYADPTTHLCILTCPSGYYTQIAQSNGNRTCVIQCQNGQWLHPFNLSCSSNPKDCPAGTYADNHTHKCQMRCALMGQVGQNSTQLCQTTCFTGYAYWSIGLCVQICPDNPALFGFVSGFTRICVSSCNSTTTGYYGDIQANRTCVKKCSASPRSTFGDNSSSLCQSACLVSNQYGDPYHPQRQCVQICSSFPIQAYSYYVSKICVAVCPSGYYGDNSTTSEIGICAISCPSNYFGDPLSHFCVTQCPYHYFGSPLGNRECVQTCPIGYFGINSTSNRLCVVICDSGYWADIPTRLCVNVKTLCSNNTFADPLKRLCVGPRNCTIGTYADLATMGCESSCTNSSADPSSGLCVNLCPFIPDYYTLNGYCTPTCTGGTYADWQANRTCSSKCSNSPLALYGNSLGRCVKASECGINLFGSNQTQLCQICSGTLPFGDPFSLQCVKTCPQVYYGDYDKNLCVQICNYTTLYFADNITRTCTKTCSPGTFGVRNPNQPVCSLHCPANYYAIDTNWLCVLDCGTGFFADPLTGKCYNNSLNCSEGYYGNFLTNKCVLAIYCPFISGVQYYGDVITKMCVLKCTSPTYGDNSTYLCVYRCPNPYYGQNNTRMCLLSTQCALYLSFADTQMNLCVSRCSSSPIDTFSNIISFMCVIPTLCPINTFADSTTQSCVNNCPFNTTYFSYAESNSRRCVLVCPNPYFSDLSTGVSLCVSSCSSVNLFKDQINGICVYICPAFNEAAGIPDTYGDVTTSTCVQTCPLNYFSQTSANRTCVTKCSSGTWGNSQTRKCITNPLVECPQGSWADNFTNLCTYQCSYNVTDGQIFYGDNSTKMCKSSCPSPSFAYFPSKVCIDICPQLNDSGLGYFGDSTTTPTRLCVTNCMTSGYYKDILNSRTCQLSCTYNSTYKTYANPNTMTCVHQCPFFPTSLFAMIDSSNNYVCSPTCISGYKYYGNMTCLSTCPQFIDPTNNQCVSTCPFNSLSNTTLYGDPVTKICVNAQNCPNNTYADDRTLLCSSSCSQNSYKENNRCVSFCSEGLFINKATLSCVLSTGCPASTFGDYQTKSCESQCTHGTFGNSILRICQITCSNNSYGNSITKICQNNCSYGLKIDLTLNLCIGSCSTGSFYDLSTGTCLSTCLSPYFADSTISACVLQCSSNPLTFGSVDPIRACVGSCPTSYPWMDTINRLCVSICPNNSVQYSLNKSCVTFCPSPFYKSLTSCIANCSSVGLFGDDTTHQCVNQCPLGWFKDPSTSLCVLECSKQPVRYYASKITNFCQIKCPNGTYGDDRSGMCVTDCPVGPITYGESLSAKCVQLCPLSNNLFGDSLSKKCVTTCPNGYFADTRQRTCQMSCGNLLYADSLTNPPSCVSVCSSTTFADALTRKCLTQCSNGYYGFSLNNTCLQFCPYSYYADPSGFCLQQCSNAPYFYADNLTHKCSSICSNSQYSHKLSTISYGFCVTTCPSGFYSDPTTMKCVSKCPSGFYGSSENNTCMTNCHEDYFMDSINNLCQQICPLANNLFGNPFTKKCAASCEMKDVNNLFADSQSRRCETLCTGNQFGDPISKRCVGINGCSNGTVSDPYYKLCVSRCYSETYSYAGTCWQICPSGLSGNQITQECTVPSSCPLGTYADPISNKCVYTCSVLSGYADDNSHSCVSHCNSPLFADNITRACLKICPITPLSFGVNSTKQCAIECPSNSYGFFPLRICLTSCFNGTYGDSSSHLCLENCTQGKFGDSLSGLCVSICPSSQNTFGDPLIGLCVVNCSLELYGDMGLSRKCLSTCPDPYFSQNTTRRCLPSCLTGFANPKTRQCLKVCSSGYYGFNLVCYKNCPLMTPTIYADDSTNLCVTTCPAGTFGQPNSLQCVQICPIALNLFGDTNNKVCVSSCSGNTYADFSTRLCTSVCSSTPALYSSPYGNICVAHCINNLFADNSTRSCVQYCPSGTYADNTMYNCVSRCSSSPMMWGENITNTCVLHCSSSYDRYADNSSGLCVINCPAKTYADSISRSCKATCPTGYFGVNSTRRCQLNCPSSSFADSLNNVCVAKCSIDPIFYGDELSNKCLDSCPSGSFSDPVTQKCAYNVGITSTCSSGYFADPISSLCTARCPMKFNLYAEPITKMCKSLCEASYFADNSTMKCVQKCPTYPNYFANLQTVICVKYCPNNKFADKQSRTCVDKCPNGTYAELTTLQCVENCPNNPLTYRDPVNWKCSTSCPIGYYLDEINLNCVLTCPQQTQTFGQNTTMTCVKICPNSSYAYIPTRLCLNSCYNSTYAFQEARTCLNVCPRIPSLYADKQQNICVQYCPNGSFAFDPTRECVYSCPIAGFYRQNTTNSCVQTCDYENNTFADNLTGYCVDRCSVGTYADPITSRCVQTCPSQPPLYGQNTTQSCINVCPTNSFGDSQNRICVQQCPQSSYSYYDLNLCVSQCPLGFYSYEPTHICISLCPEPYYGDPSTRSCVLICPLNQLLYADNTTRTCKSNCPTGSYAYQWDVNCLTECPIAIPPFVQTYAADYDHTCTVQCAYPFYSYPPTRSCITTCPQPYFNDMESHSCAACPLNCASCINKYQCAKCVLGFYLQNGECLSKCSLIYYANLTTQTCVTSQNCNPLFGENNTRICSSTCPLGSFYNNAVYRCDACPSACLECVSSNYCTSCKQNTLFQFNYCFAYCNGSSLVNPNFATDNKTCIQTCPNQTYLSAVYCRFCTGDCLTCQNTSTYCLSCRRNLYNLNGSCYAKCPDNYKPDLNRRCVPCNPCVSLSYSTNVTNINGQVCIFLNFNNPYNLIGNIYSIFNITSFGLRLLQTSASSYKIELVDEVTIKITFPPGQVQSQYFLHIVNPLGLTDLNGNLPDQLISEIKIDLGSYYSMTVEQASNSFPTYFTFLSIIALFSLLFDIELLKFLQLVYIHFFVLMNLPPALIKAFNGFKFSTLYYLPSFFRSPDVVLRPNVPDYINNSIGDYSFLRNAGFVLTPLAIILFNWALMKLMSVHEINPLKNLRLWCRSILQQKFKYAVFLQFIGAGIVSIALYAFLQMRDITIYDSFSLASVVLAFFFTSILFFVCFYVAFKVFQFCMKYPDLSENINKASELILQDSQADRLIQTNIFLFQRKKIDLRNPAYPKINQQNIFPFKCIYNIDLLSLLCPSVEYLRVLLLSAVISFSTSAIMQMSLSISISILSLYYFCRARPYNIEIRGFYVRNYIAIFHTCSLLILQVLMLVLAIMQYNNAASSSKEAAANNIIYFLGAVCTLSFLYQLFSISICIYRKVWLVVIQTEYFKRSFPTLYAKYQADKIQKSSLLRTIHPKAKQALKRMIQGYKRTKSYLRPSESQKQNPSLPIRYKITYFDQGVTSSNSSRTTMTKNEKRKMLRSIFSDNDFSEGEDGFQQEAIDNKRAPVFQPECLYEQYEEEISINPLELKHYVANAQFQLLKNMKFSE